MEQGTNIRKNKKLDLQKEKDNAPFMKVDKYGNPISNFITNFINKFRQAKGLGLRRLLRGKPTEQQKQAAQPESVIGATKTVFRSDFRNAGKSLTVQTPKKPALRIDNAIKTQQARPKTNKPKLGL